LYIAAFKVFTRTAEIIVSFGDSFDHEQQAVRPAVKTDDVQAELNRTADVITMHQGI